MKASEEISNKGITKKKMFKNITEQLNKQGYGFSWEQVQGKWKTLVSSFKRTKDHNNKSGNERKTCAFQKELEQILEGNPSIKPIAISSSSIFSVKRKSSSDNDDDDDEENNKDEDKSSTEQDEKDGKITINSDIIKKARKTNSTQMVDIMKQYISDQQAEKKIQREERQKIHNEKKDMHKEKMNLFRDLLNQLK